MKPAAAVLLTTLTAASLGGGAGECPRTPEPGEPLRGLSADELARFAEGRAVFERVFSDSAGLGPLFNANGCIECHEDPEVGGNGDESETHAAVAGPDGACDLLAAHGGPVFQAHGTPALQAALGIDREPLPPGSPGLATRTAPDLFGFGLLDAVPDSEIEARADPGDRDHDGISGRASRLADGRIGRFGRKAVAADLDEFNAGAFVIEMGITNPVVPNEESIGGRPIPRGVDPRPEPELSATDLARVNDFVRFLAPPAPLALTTEGERGRIVFGTLGCASCHTAALRTRSTRSHALDRRLVYAYTDLLLHDMGPERADICMAQAAPAEFRTEPLMGLRFATRYLHDGAAGGLEQAIELHGGEAARVRERFRRLDARSRAALLLFLRSL
jgi:CxxC motif-containing protein (DUF1111 family)